MAPGSRKDLGCFFVKRSNTKKAVLCEFAIDAISYFALQPNCLALSTSGVNPNPAWLPLLIEKGFDIYCGFDSDDTGNLFSNRMIYLYPTVKRLRPVKNDWNEDRRLKSAPYLLSILRSVVNLYRYSRINHYLEKKNSRIQGLLCEPTDQFI